MRTKQKYINVKRVFYDRITGERSETRTTKQQTCFDSTAEFHCYQMISRYFKAPMFDIDVHNTLSLGAIDWKLDFQITARRNQPLASAILAELVNTFHDTNHTSLGQIFIEYKGMQDDNFLDKMSLLSTTTPMFTKTIILVSDHTTAFGCYDSKRNRFYCHPIVSSHILEQQLQNVTQSHKQG